MSRNWTKSAFDTIRTDLRNRKIPTSLKRNDMRLFALAARLPPLHGASLKTILLVDDSKFQRLANQRILGRAGYEVLAASDGEEGLRIARSAAPNLIVLDMLLPKLGGPEVLKALQLSEQTRSIPVLVLSGLAQKNEAKLLAEGARAYFEKSRLDLQDGPKLFLAVVKEILNTRDDRVAVDCSQEEPQTIGTLLIDAKIGGNQ